LSLQFITQDNFDSYELLNKTEVLNDIVLFFFILGNDFLPHVPAIDIHYDGVDILFKVYVENVENMKLEYTKQYTVISIKHSALQDIRDVLYEQITSLHSEIEKYKEKNKKYDKERSELMEELDKLKVIEKEKLSLETEIEKIKGDLKTMCENYNQLLYQHTQNINVQQQASNYYPYYYYPYYQSTP
jgi:5'-3' exoribonuclease 2